MYTTFTQYPQQHFVAELYLCCCDVRCTTTVTASLLETMTGTGIVIAWNWHCIRNWMLGRCVRAVPIMNLWEIMETHEHHRTSIEWMHDDLKTSQNFGMEASYFQEGLWLPNVSIKLSKYVQFHSDSLAT